MHRIVELTKDGSPTITIPEKNITYHSRHGAINESQHIYINAGLQYFLSQHHNKAISIFEMGFGTGLNALLTLQLAIAHQIDIHYHAIECYPLTTEEVNQLHYNQIPEAQPYFAQLHACEWGKDYRLHPYFTIHKTNQSLEELVLHQQYHVVYFDAFAPSEQPELWTAAIFSNIFQHLEPNGVLVTYSSKVSVRKAMQQVGFEVEKIAGPIGKAEIVRAVKQG